MSKSGRTVKSRGEADLGGLSQPRANGPRTNVQTPKALKGALDRRLLERPLRALFLTDVMFP